jgi:heat shock protein HslJ
MSNSRLLSAFAVVASLASLIVGCAASTSPSSPSSITNGSNTVTIDQLAGTWNLVSIQSASQPEQAVPQGASYVLTFAYGRLSTRVDCNVCNGPFTLSGQTLTAGPALACTRAACPTMAFENTYTTLLSGDSAVTLSANTLVMSSARGALRFAR